MMSFKPPAIYIDGHVHLYPCFDPVRFFSVAQENFTRAARADGLEPEACTGVLLLTETSKDSAFAQLGADPRLPQGWTVRAANGDPALILQAPVGGVLLVVIAGRQIQTAERVEVLGLTTAAAVPDDGTPLARTLEILRDQDIPAVLPWGFGKWFGRRGRLVKKVLDGDRQLFAGDNAGRPIWWRTPPVFGGARVLPGSDPLPYAGGETSVGSYGFVLDGPLDLERPGLDLRGKIMGLSASPRPFGQRVGPLGFFRGQLRLRIG